MTLSEMLYATLQPLVDGRVYPAVAPQDSALPRLVYSRAGGRVINYAEPGELPDHDGARVQLSAWATTNDGAELLMQQVEAAMAASPHFSCERLGGPVSAFEEDTQLHGLHHDFAVWYAR